MTPTESILSPWAHMRCAPWACWVNLRGGVWVHDPLTEFVMVEQLGDVMIRSQRWKSYLALAWSCQFTVWCCAATLNTDFGGPSKYQLSNIGSPCKEYVVRIVCALHVVVECSWLWSSKVVARIRHQKLGASRKPFLANFLHAESFKDTSASSCLAKPISMLPQHPEIFQQLDFQEKIIEHPNPQNPENLLTAACLWLHQAQTPKRPIYFNDLTLRCGDTGWFGDGLGKVDHDPRRTLPSSTTFVQSDRSNSTAFSYFATAHERVRLLPWSVVLFGSAIWLN